MTKRDGELRPIFERHLKEFDWQSVETWSTGRGVPDLNFCHQSTEGWVELKSTNAWAVKMEPGQVAWTERRARAGGRVFLAVRRLSLPGPRKGAKVDELWLLHHSAARLLATPGKNLRDLAPGDQILGLWGQGPSNWDWDRVEEILIK